MLTRGLAVPHDSVMNRWLGTLRPQHRGWLSALLLMVYGFAFLMALYFVASIVRYGFDDMDQWLY